MKRILLGTTALAFAGAMGAGQASAADMLSIGVHGYLEQWVGMADSNGHMIDHDNNDATPMVEKEGAFEVQADTEIHFRGSLEADNGLTFTVDVQLEGTNGGLQGHNDDNDGTTNLIDESFLKITGDFGDVRIGSEDHASNLMHYGHQDVGIGLTAGDTGNWLGFGTPNTYGSFADIQRVVYYTPRMEGVQLGVSYTPDVKLPQAVQNGAKTTANNDRDSASVGLNYKGAIGESSVAVSGGYRAISAAMSGDDDSTYTNFGLQVGMGAFGFNAAYAENDDGKDGDSKDDTETVTVGAMYSDGPMAFSAGYGMMDRGSGTDMTSVMLSASYALAPGVSWRSSLFQAEDGDKDGSGFVTGFKLGF